jgi:putative ABC transport system substrate-binding protein
MKKSLYSILVATVATVTRKKPMNKKTVVSFLALAISILASVHLAEAQQPVKVPRIGFLSARSGPESREEAFLQGLRQLGYIERQNIVIEWRFAKGKADRFPELASELVRLEVDVIVAGGGDATVAAKNATGTLPIVTPTGGIPVETGLVASLGRPGGNITGLSTLSAELSGKRLELLKESFPRLSRVAVLYHRASNQSKLDMAETERAAQLLKVQLQQVGVEDSNDLENAFSAMTKGRAEALL